MRIRNQISARAITLLVVLAMPIGLAAQTSYDVVNLVGLGGTSWQALSINDRGWISGSSNQSGDTVSHATLWVDGSLVDLGTLGKDTVDNSGVFWPVKNNKGLIVGVSETDDINPYGETFSCAYFFPTFTHHICLGFRWKDGVMTALPTLGGYDSYAAAANNRGQVVGWAENSVHDPTCAGDQVLQFRAVVWGPNSEIQELKPLPGDSTSAATAINDRGQVVGISGTCGFAVGGVSAAHAVIWEKGIPTDLGNFGGTAWNTPTAINNKGIVVGFSLPGDQNGTHNYRAFSWSKRTGILQLPQFAGDTRSAAFGINDDDEIVGLSKTSSGTFRAVIWQGGEIVDLNTMVAPGSSYLIFANDIDDDGKIVGEAFDPNTGDTPGFVAVPRDRGESSMIRATPNVILPENIMKRLRRIRGIEMGE